MDVERNISPEYDIYITALAAAKLQVLILRIGLVMINPIEINSNVAEGINGVKTKHNLVNLNKIRKGLK
ncbi:hypothetical protein NQ317_009170 [Molorchus minor]|uniref:Uncharacterized protein n=1 Tax=Molorchus minor TaxID=1323400 RepID=A0ABQ9J510_9CUCU|nr:hypothetical protein NQ317_009170 [Molorchus minor]